MTNFNQDLERLQKSLRTQFYCFIGLIILSSFSCLISYNLGRIRHEREIIQRAKELPENVDCWSNTDIEILIFGEPQI